jgi:hypothetical protein
MKIKDEYQRGVGRRRKSKADIIKTAAHATTMLDWLDNKSGIDKGTEDYTKIRKALERTAKHPRRTETNYDYEVMASLIDLSVNKRQGIKFDPKLTSYNSALPQVGKE